MVKTVTVARKATRKVIESTYEGVCTIVERRDVRDEVTKITRKSEVTVIKNQPCKLSFERLNAAVQTDAATTVSQNVKLFMSPDIIINAGSKIIVEQDGKKNEYFASGEPAIYFTHQEVLLELFKGWT